MGTELTVSYPWGINVRRLALILAPAAMFAGLTCYAASIDQPRPAVYMGTQSRDAPTANLIAACDALGGSELTASAWDDQLDYSCEFQ